MISKTRVTNDINIEAISVEVLSGYVPYCLQKAIQYRKTSYYMPVYFHIPRLTFCNISSYIITLYCKRCRINMNPATKKPPEDGRLYERKDSHVQENSFGHAGRCLCINSYSCPGIRLPWQPEVNEVPLLQLFHNKASGKVRWVQHTWWYHCRGVCAMQAVQSVAQNETLYDADNNAR